MGRTEFYKTYLKPEGDNMSLEDFLYCMDDVDPLTEQTMWDGEGSMVSQLHDTIPRICELWLSEGIREQANGRPFCYLQS